MRHRLFSALIIALAVLTICQQKSASAVVPTASTPSQTRPVLVGKALRDAAFRTAFGKARNVSIMLPAEADGTGGGTMRVTADKLYRLGDGYLLISQLDNPETCHPCSGGLALSHLSRKGTAPGSLIEKTQIIEDGNGFGAPPGWRLDSRLLSAPLLILDLGYAGQGCEVTYHALYDLDARKLTENHILVAMRTEALPWQRAGATKGIMSGIVKNKGFDMIYRGMKKLSVHYTYDGHVFRPDMDVTTLPGC